MTATGLPFLVTVTRSCVPTTSSITWLKCALIDANERVSMTIILVTKPRPVNQLGKGMNRYPTRIEAVRRRVDDGQDPSSRGHVKAPRARRRVAHRCSQGDGPRLVVAGRLGVAGSGEREGEMAVGHVSVLDEHTVELPDDCNHFRRGAQSYAIERQNSGHHAAAAVQPHQRQASRAGTRSGFGQDFCPPDAQFGGGRDGGCRAGRRHAGSLDDSRDDPGADPQAALKLGGPVDSAPVPVRLLRRTKSRDTRAGCLGTSRSVSEGRHATYAHGYGG